ncbi:NACHT domain-containing protein, partial [Anaerolineae bacterium CFX7]|nr:NACHT domain-containing protein [Anaerolineae bacterium CFX7]
MSKEFFGFAVERIEFAATNTRNVPADVGRALDAGRRVRALYSKLALATRRDKLYRPMLAVLRAKTDFYGTVWQICNLPYLLSVVHFGEKNSMDENSPLALPPELKARLDAAGVTDEESLQAALERDPELRAQYETFLNEHRDEIFALQMAALLTAFAQTENDAQIVEFWNQVPREWKQPFLDAAQNVIAQAEANGQGENVAGFKARLEALTRIVQQLRALENLSPVQRAVMGFIGAPDEAAAREIFERERARLQPYEAQQLLESLAQADEPQIRQRVQERLALLRELRDVAPKPPPLQPLTPNPSPIGRGAGERDVTIGDLVAGDKIIQGDSFAAQRDMTVNKVAAGGTLNVTNINNFNFEYEWLPPSPPRPTGVIPREKEVDEVLKKLAEHDAVAIGGRAVAVQGMAGIGKTTLAQILAHLVYQKAPFPEYADGVLWTELGHEWKTREHAQAVLNEWASYALRGNLEGRNFTPNAVRQLLERRPKLLVILDNVWYLDVVQPLQAALPAEARLLITTRSRDVMRNLHGGMHELDKLSLTDAYALVKLRLQWEPANDADKQWVEELFHALDYHALALAVALGLLGRQPAQAMWRATAEKIIHSVQHGDEFDILVMPANERQENVERSLWVSYDALNENEKTRWRALGAFALEAPFATRFAARVWDCDDETAHAQLTDFMNAALVSSSNVTGFAMQASRNLSRLEGLEWQQHALLRGYALALLKDAGELEQTQARHARAYAEAMRVADDEQRYYEMRGAYPQLKHAFEWAIVQDLDRAQDLIANCFNLQTAFGNTFDNYQWGLQALEAAKLRGTRANVARAQGSLGNALSRVATLPGQDRRQRLQDALAAYDAALQHYRPDTAPLEYATTQNNRATLLSALATLPGEDRRQRLQDALA